MRQNYFFVLVLFLTSLMIMPTAQAQTTVTIGTGTSSSSTRGPIHVSGGGSSTVYSRFNQVYTAAELANAGLTSGATIEELKWFLKSTNVITGAGDATFKVYIKNSSVTEATSDSWTNIISGATLVVDNVYNTTNNFPGVEDWMAFPFIAPYTYNGGALEIAVDWNSSAIPVDAFNGGGAIKWQYEATPFNSVAKKTASSGASSTLSDVVAERANIQIVFNAPAGAPQTGTIGTGTSSSSARGPIQRSEVSSTSVFSRFNQVYTAAELAAIGVLPGATINDVAWELASSNTIIGTGDATLKIYVRNSSATTATADTWVVLTAGSTLAYDGTFNTTNNFPGANGWMVFDFASTLVYTGGALEIAVDWDCSNVSTPAFSGDGSLKWRYEATASKAPLEMVAKKTASSSAPSTLSDLITDRANIQIGFANPVPLPVELSSFDGKVMELGNQLDWVTYSELSNEGFEVQKSSDARSWEKIGFVVGNGTTSEANHYQFLDRETSSTVQYYRLKQMDFEGTFTYSEIIALQRINEEKPTFKTYPNPIMDQFTIEQFQGTVFIYNTVGGLMKVVEIQNEIETLSFSDFQNGQYFLQFVGDDGQQMMQKIVKMSN